MCLLYVTLVISENLLMTRKHTVRVGPIVKRYPKARGDSANVGAARCHGPEGVAPVRVCVKIAQARVICDIVLRR